MSDKKEVAQRRVAEFHQLIECQAELTAAYLRLLSQQHRPRQQLADIKSLLELVAEDIERLREQIAGLLASPDF